MGKATRLFPVLVVGRTNLKTERERVNLQQGRGSLVLNLKDGATARSMVSHLVSSTQMSAAIL